MTANTEAAS